MTRRDRTGGLLITNCRNLFHQSTQQYLCIDTGPPSATDAAALKRISPNTTEVTYKKGGKVVATARNSVSKDGKVMAVTAKGKIPTAQSSTSTRFNNDNRRHDRFSSPRNCSPNA